MDLASFFKLHEIEYLKNQSLSDLSYVGIGGCCALVVYPKNRGEFLRVLTYFSQKSIPYKVIGNASNILFMDGYLGVCLISTKKLRDFYIEQNVAVAECGLPLSVLCNKMLKADMYPPCELYGIPATVGGAIYQNAGAYGASISDHLVYIDVYDPRADRVFRLFKDELRFAYRKSDLSEKGKLLCAGFSSGEGKLSDAERLISSYIYKRRASQPKEPSLGSVFLRVGDVSAAYYIERAGLKGVRIGGACVSKVHAGFIVNLGNASARDYLAMIDLVRSKVFERFGILLETEIEILKERKENAWLHFV